MSVRDLWASNVIQSFVDHVAPILLDAEVPEGASSSSSTFPKDAKTLFETETAGLLVHDVRIVPHPVFVYANQQAARIFEADDADGLIGRH